MRFNYFEEFPERVSDKQLEMAIGQTVFVAAKSYDDFLRIEEDFRVRNGKVDYAYWPLMESSYWVSPFTSLQDLKKLEVEIMRDAGKHKILVDVEFPFFRLHRFVLGLLGFFEKKKIISKIVKDYPNIYTAENPASSTISLLIKEALGMSYRNEHQIIMYYQCSPINRLMRALNMSYLRKHVLRGANVIIGLGTNSRGPYGLGFPSSREEIHSDAVRFQTELGVNEFYVYQLSGEKE